MVETVRCSSGHRFPVNMEKHQHQTYVMCPHRGCHEKVKIRGRRFSFNLEWSKIKAETKMSRLEAKEKKRRQPATPMTLLPRPTRVGMSQSLAGVLALSAAMKKAEEKREEEEKEE
ncbi:hypothetical protein D4R42_05420 [bacterium]|nr:MAG: hypothetical protein D4R42_05420 [bacterium]